MRRFIYLWIVWMVGIAVLVACALAVQEEAGQATETPGARAEDGEVVFVGADVQRREGAVVGDDELAALVHGNNGFASELYQAAVAGNDENLIFSPYSISLALSMAYAGAHGDTAAQMQEVLHFLEQEQQHRAFNGLERHLSDLGAGQVMDVETGPAFQLDVANAVWGQRGAPFQEAYLQTLAGEYGAGLQAVDFAGNPEAARQVINAWIADATQGRIENMVAPGTLDANTQLVLANAIYFYGAWLQPFDESDTEEGTFTELDGTVVTVPLMHQSMARVGYVEAEGFRAVQLPYTGEKVDMLLILPDDGRFAEVQGRLDAAILQAVRDEASTHDVTLTLPRFDFESELDLAQLLPQLGLTLPFSSQADFGGILEDGVSIDAALHKATITVDEKGTEAAAATVVEMAVSEMPRGEFEATRPFMLAIVERETGAVLFLGRVVQARA